MTVSAAAQSGSSSTSTATSATSSALTQNTQFLQILMTELQHQNPLSPTDVNTFVSQLTSYSSLEQQITTNSKLDSINSLLSSATAAFLNDASSKSS